MSRTSPRIERAAALLDMTAPGWDRKIDLHSLDMSNVRYCILGQVYGRYTVGLEALDGDAEKRPGHYGFMPWGRERFYALTCKWRDYLSERLQRSEAA